MRNTTSISQNKVLLAAALVAAVPSMAGVLIQCPGGDPAGTAVTNQPGVVCMSLTAGDGYVSMADGKPVYIFGFSNHTGTPASNLMLEGLLGANYTAPSIVLDEGDRFYLNLTNVGMVVRSDLFDAHTVHWHGFPNAASVFDGVPDASIAIHMGSTFTYFYKASDPGTYMYHCHVEAFEHMQMGMLGQLWVRPKQNKLPDGTNLNGFTHHTGYKYAYNDGDGSTYYDVEIGLQEGSFDPNFHHADETFQPPPFAEVRDKYAMLNGRGYPDTVNPNPLPPPAENGGKPSQLITGLVQAKVGNKILVRLSNLNTTRSYSVTTLGIPMTVIAKDAKLLRGPVQGPGQNFFYKTSSVTIGSGEAIDFILDSTGLSGRHVLLVHDQSELPQQ